MCGVCGVVSFGGPPDRGLLLRMMGRLVHRGPDSCGYYRDREVALGHTRLAIIDTAGGAQPLCNEDGSLWASFNGEIFNYERLAMGLSGSRRPGGASRRCRRSAPKTRAPSSSALRCIHPDRRSLIGLPYGRSLYVELGAELRDRGHRFRTASDTEVIVHAWGEWGEDCSQRFNGQWALALWDRRQRRLVLSRDRLGVRPLYFTRTPEGLLFASEVKALFADPSVVRAFDPVGLDQVLTYWSTVAPRTMFEKEYYHADRLNYVVSGTPNRPEYDQGFFVKLGDGSADVKPIVHPYKSQVYQLAEYLGVPQEIGSRPSTTDTYSLSQSQEEFYFSLPYQRMDLCLFGKNNGVPVDEVAAATGLTGEQVVRVFRDIDQKRRTTEYLHLAPELAAGIPEIVHGRSDIGSRLV